MAEIFENILLNIDDRYDKTSGEFVYDIIKAIGLELTNQDSKVGSILEAIDVEKLVKDDLERFIYQRSGLSRKTATYASTIVLITGANNAVIPSGSLVAADDIFYSVDEETQINSDGQAYVKVTCTSPGAVGNVPIGSINSFPVTIQNIFTVTNENVVNNGYEEESDQELRARYYEKLQKPGKAGNEYHYLEWAKSIVGVGKVKVFPTWNGPLTVKVSILTSNTEVASEDLIQRVSKYINSQKPFGANVTVVSGTKLPVNISVELIVEPTFSEEELRIVLKERLQNYLKTLTYESSYISYAQIGREILSIEGIQDYKNLLINGSNDNILLEEESVPVVGDLT